jgi:hypothetical protein
VLFGPRVVLVLAMPFAVDACTDAPLSNGLTTGRHSFGAFARAWGHVFPPRAAALSIHNLNLMDRRRRMGDGVCHECRSRLERRGFMENPINGRPYDASGWRILEKYGSSCSCSFC